MHAPLTQPRRKTHWTYAEYYRMAEMGFFRDQRVELINGEIIEMPPQGEEHGVGILLLTKVLNSVFAAGHVVRVQLPLHTGVNEEPEPDIAVVAGDIRDSIRYGRPSSALLIVEVAGTTLAYDLGEKAEIYAAAGITEYWVLDLEGHCLVVHRRPEKISTAARGARYADITTLKAHESISPLAAANRAVRIADVLP
ncbi:MAG TPA: Uma2 family endonuclease [Tepidisphaeraceae bacterium]|jgi:Uma2 family endonuclease|nr:Uma2 family endonuclease [Tepidisphaeraceae bacterium]